jgi:hypothetical protein
MLLGLAGAMRGFLTAAKPPNNGQWAMAAAAAELPGEKGVEWFTSLFTPPPEKVQPNKLLSDYDVKEGSEKYSWWRLWHIPLAVVALLCAVNAANSITIWWMMMQPALPLGHAQHEAVEAGIQHLKNGLRYQEIMQGISFSPAEIAEKVQAATVALKEKEHVHMVQAAAHRMADTCVAITVFVCALWRRKDLRGIWDQTRFLMRKHFRTLLRVLVMVFITDVFCGFHSNELWHELMEFAFHRYGFHSHHGHDIINMVKMTFPVICDTLFKFAVFSYVQTKTQVLLKDFDG